jgi:hypothetical protein
LTARVKVGVDVRVTSSRMHAYAQKFVSFRTVVDQDEDEKLVCSLACHLDRMRRVNNWYASSSCARVLLTTSPVAEQNYEAAPAIPNLDTQSHNSHTSKYLVLTFYAGAALPGLALYQTPTVLWNYTLQDGVQFGMVTFMHVESASLLWEAFDDVVCEAAPCYIKPNSCITHK